MAKTIIRRAALLVCIMLAGTLFLVGCGGNGGSNGAGGTSTAGSTSTPQTGAASEADSTASTGSGGEALATGKDSITYVLYAVPNILDPQYSSAPTEKHVNYTIYDGLFRPIENDYTRCEPWLLESYELSEDNKDWTLHIREGVLFHNGEELTSEDVAFMLERAKESPINAEAVATMGEVTIIDKYTVKFEQDVPFPIWPETLASVTLGVPNKKLIEEYGSGAYEAICGTGSHKIKSWSADNTITVEYFEDWFMRDEYDIAIKECIYRPIPDANAATIAFDSGEVDVIGVSILQSDYQRYRDDPDVNTFEIKLNAMRGLSMNHESDVFGDVRVRRAVNHSFDKESINLIVAEGNNIAPIWCKFNPDGEGYAAAEAQNKIVKYEYDVDKAKALLAEAGYDESNPIRTIMLSSSPIDRLALAQALQDYLAQVNIIAEVEAMETAQYMQRVSTGDYECAGAQWNNAPYWSAFDAAVWNEYGAYYNYEQYNNPRVNEIVTDLRATWALEDREPMMVELINITTEEAIIAPVYQIMGMVATNGGLVVYPEIGDQTAALLWMHY